MEGTVKLFAVHNTAHNVLFVLAPDEKTAMSIAHTANHVYSPEQKTALDYSRAAHEICGDLPSQFRDHSRPIQQAIARSLQGTVHIDSGVLAVGYEVIEV